MDLQLITALILGKTIAFLNKLSGSGATAAPGLYALKVDPNILKKLSKKIKKGTIVISGTNGKTTTARLTFDILSAKYKIIHNRQGSNLLRGIASTFIKHSSIFGKIDFDLALWEVDEATLPEVVKNINPKTVVLLNLFRDQLDRYGEVDTTRSKWQKALLKLPKESTLVLNADDPSIPQAAKFSKARSVYFGVGDIVVKLPSIGHIADVKHCPNCENKIVYEALFSSHLGHYKCSNCDFKRPKPQIIASNLTFKQNFSTSLTLTINNQTPLAIHANFPGLYNVYNVVAAAAIANKYGISAAKLRETIESFSTAFGRFQSLSTPTSPVFDPEGLRPERAGMGSKSVLIFLIKNPTGANEVLRVLALKKKLNLLIILNDKIADGRDVSWIWDTNWEVLKDKIKMLTISGTRDWDMATRLKYADYKLSKNNIYKEINYSIIGSLDKLNKGDTLIILPTYTSMLEVQKVLHNMGAISKWHKQ